MSVPIAVFASGSGTNLQSLLERFTNSEIAHIALVISDRADAGALQRARDANVNWLHIPVRDRPADDVVRETLTALTAHDIQLIALGGYLRLVPPAIVERYRNRILNIHPALLPSFGGKGMYGARVHAAVLEAGCTVTGVTVHRVDERYDEGGIIAQWPVPVLPDDTPATLGARVLRVEHRLYPAVVAAVARNVARAGAAMRHDTRDVFRLTDALSDVETDMTSILRITG